MGLTTSQTVSESYTQVTSVDEPHNEYSLNEVLSISDNFEQTLQMSMELFNFRMRTSNDLEKMFEDGATKIYFKSYQLEDRSTIIQLKYPNPQIL